MSHTRPEFIAEPPSPYEPPAVSGSSTAHPGWYADPRRDAPWRWWDGSQWTEYVQSAEGSVWLVAPHSDTHDQDLTGPATSGGGIAAVSAGLGFAASALVVVIYMVSTSRPWNLNMPWLIASSEVLLWMGFVGAVVVASHRHGTSSLARDFGFGLPTVKDIRIGLLGGVVGGVVPIALGILAIWAQSGFKSSRGAGPNIAGITPEGTAGWIVVILLVAVGAPIVEELFFRGLVQGAFMRRIGSTPAIFVTALIFCGLHSFNEGPIAPIVLFAPALVLGYLRLKTGRLAPGMVAHATFNALTLCLLLIPTLR